MKSDLILPLFQSGKHLHAICKPINARSRRRQKLALSYSGSVYVPSHTGFYNSKNKRYEQPSITLSCVGSGVFHDILMSHYVPGTYLMCDGPMGAGFPMAHRVGSQGLPEGEERRSEDRN